MTAATGRNPFSPPAIATLEGRPAGAGPLCPTIMRPPIRRLTAVVRDYLDGDPELRAGRVAALHGDHGSGKTHTMQAVLGAAAAAGTPLRSVYVRIDGPDPLALFRKVGGQISRADLEQLARHARADYALEEFLDNPDLRDREEAQARAASLRDRPDSVLAAIAQHDLTGTSVIDRQDEDLRSIEGGERSFERALRALLEPERSGTAHRWLVGAELTPDEARDLGVSGSLADRRGVALRLRVLARLCRRVRLPVLLVLDQVEALLVSASGEVDQENAGLLRDLIEVVASESGCLLLAMNTPMWRALPTDLRQRVGADHFEQEDLSLAEAEALVAAYLTPQASGSGPGRLQPFTVSGVRELLVVARGNTRAFLQQCAVAFDRVSRPITDTRVRAELPGSLPDLLTDVEVRQRTAQALHRVGLTVRTEVSLDGSHADFVVYRGKRAMLAVEIVGSMLETGEARQALDTLRAVASKLGPAVRTLVVVWGYAAPDVATQMREAATEVVAVLERDEAEELDATVERLVAEHRPDGVLLSELQERFDRVSRRLEEETSARRRDSALVAAKLDELIADQEAARRTDKRREFRLSWLEEHARLIGEISRARTAQHQAELDQIVGQHTVVLESRRRQQLSAVAVAAAAAVGAALVLALVISSERVPAVVATVALAAALITQIILRTQSAPAAVPSVESTAALEDHLRAQVPKLGSGSLELRQQLASADPYRRYAAALARPAPRDLLLARLHREPVTLVRRAMARAVATQPDGPHLLLDDGYDEDVVAVAIDALRGGRDLPPDWTRALTPRLTTLACLCDLPVKPVSVLDRMLRQVVRPVYREDQEAPAELLAAAFRQEDDDLLAEALATIPERELRNARQLLSPDGAGSVGQWHWLRDIGLVDDLYLFFHRALMFSARMKS